MCVFNTDLQESPGILQIDSTKSLLSSCVYNVHEMSLIDGEFKLNYQKHKGERGKKTYLIMLLHNYN